MKLKDAKMTFIQSWGALGSSWGISRSMAQIHALLLATPDALSTEEVMETIKLSRGNVNLNLRELMAWGLITKQNKLGERKEYFIADHDIMRMTKKIIYHRKKREMQPAKEMIHGLNSTQLVGDTHEVDHFQKITTDLNVLLNQMEKVTAVLEKLDGNVVFKKLFSVLT